MIKHILHQNIFCAFVQTLFGTVRKRGGVGVSVGVALILQGHLSYSKITLLPGSKNANLTIIHLSDLLL